MLPFQMKQSKVLTDEMRTYLTEVKYRSRLL